MEIKISHGENMVIALKGRLDTVTSQELLAAFANEEVKESLLIVDMKELEYISSAGLRALLAMKKELVANGKQLEIHNLNNICLEVFKVTGFINVLTVK
jgi:anti-sigma B factor antagonist